MFPKSRRDDTIALALLALLAIPVVYYSLVSGFVRESGDNIVHYYFARYAFDHPRLFLDFWAKPVFTILASPFAQLGFGGMKLFNGLAGLLSAGIAYLSAKKLGFRVPWLAILFTFFAPTYFTLLFSGYTEPLFGLFLIASFCLVLKKRYISAAVLVSFIPFIRTEGVMMIVLFGLYYCLKKQWKSLPFLATGSAVLTIAGILSGKGPFWIISDVPYSVTSDYGSGTLTHYAVQWVLAVGIPLTVSSLAGLVLLLMRGVKIRRALQAENGTELYLLLPALFLAYFIFHTLAWHWGLFTSYGLIRILVPLIPLQALISLFAVQQLLRNVVVNKRIATVILSLFLLYVTVFPFLGNPASVNWKRDFRERPELSLMHTISREVKAEFPDAKLYYSEPFFSFTFGLDPFDNRLHDNFTEMPLSDIPNGSVVIWDSWTSEHFAAYKHDFTMEEGFERVKEYNTESFGRTVIFRIYKKR